MKIKYLIDEDFINYKTASMFIGTAYCNGKCYKDLGMSCDMCQNHEMMTDGIFIDVDIRNLIERYIRNDITEAIIFAGLEPFDQFHDIKEFIDIFRNEYHNEDDIIIYTGYNKDEILDKVNELTKYKNIIIKYGRYVPNQSDHLDTVLGVKLASDNQYAEKIS